MTASPREAFPQMPGAGNQCRFGASPRPDVTDVETEDAAAHVGPPETKALSAIN